MAKNVIIRSNINNKSEILYPKTLSNLVYDESSDCTLDKIIDKINPIHNFFSIDNIVADSRDSNGKFADGRNKLELLPPNEYYNQIPTFKTTTLKEDNSTLEYQECFGWVLQIPIPVNRKLSALTISYYYKILKLTSFSNLVLGFGIEYTDGKYVDKVIDLPKNTKLNEWQKLEYTLKLSPEKEVKNIYDIEFIGIGESKDDSAMFTYPMIEAGSVAHEYTGSKNYVTQSELSEKLTNIPNIYLGKTEPHISEGELSIWLKDV